MGWIPLTSLYVPHFLCPRFLPNQHLRDLRLHQRLSHTTLFAHLISFRSMSSFPCSAGGASSLLSLFTSGISFSEKFACFLSPPTPHLTLLELASFSSSHPEILCSFLGFLCSPCPTTLHLRAEIFCLKNCKLQLPHNKLSINVSRMNGQMGF